MGFTLDIQIGTSFQLSLSFSLPLSFPPSSSFHSVALPIFSPCTLCFRTRGHFLVSTWHLIMCYLMLAFVAGPHCCSPSLPKGQAACSRCNHRQADSLLKTTAAHERHCYAYNKRQRYGKIAIHDLGKSEFFVRGLDLLRAIYLFNSIVLCRIVYHATHFCERSWVSVRHTHVHLYLYCRVTLPV